MANKGYEYFNYFDQYVDTEIDLRPYIDKFSTEGNPIVFSNMQPVKATLKNIFEQVKVLSEYRNNITFFEKYSIMDGDKIENVSHKLYGVIEYWWIIAIFNGMDNIFINWPKTNSQLQAIATRMANEEGVYPYETYYKLLFEKNESKRSILVLKLGQIPELIWEIRSLISKNTEGIIL